MNKYRQNKIDHRLSQLGHVCIFSIHRHIVILIWCCTAAPTPTLHTHLRWSLALLMGIPTRRSSGWPSHVLGVKKKSSKPRAIYLFILIMNLLMLEGGLDVSVCLLRVRFTRRSQTIMRRSRQNKVQKRKRIMNQCFLIFPELFF